MPVTISRPKVSANAVAAVRRGLRTALVRASVPIRPNGRPMTWPSGRITRPDSSGDSNSAPMPTRTSPSPMSAAPLPAEEDIAPSAVTPAPTARKTAPMMLRRRVAAAVGVANSSRIAATGGIEDARRAGAYADSSVTPVPTTTATITVRTASTIEPDGSPTLSASSRVRNPNASPTPPATPTALPATPMIPASSSTERRTWVRLAPTARSSASSRSRCATIIANVL